MSKPWTYKELGLIRTWQEDGVPHAEQGRRLGRTVASVKRAVVRHGLQGHPMHRAVWLRVEILDRLSRGETVTAIAAGVGRTRERVWFVVKELKAAGLVASNGKTGRHVRYRVTGDGAKIGRRAAKMT